MCEQGCILRLDVKYDRFSIDIVHSIEVAV